MTNQVAPVPSAPQTTLGWLKSSVTSIGSSFGQKTWELLADGGSTLWEAANIVGSYGAVGLGFVASKVSGVSKVIGQAAEAAHGDRKNSPVQTISVQAQWEQLHQSNEKGKMSRTARIEKRLAVIERDLTANKGDRSALESEKADLLERQAEEQEPISLCLISMNREIKDLEIVGSKEEIRDAKLNRINIEEDVREEGFLHPNAKDGKEGTERLNIMLQLLDKERKELTNEIEPKEPENYLPLNSMATTSNNNDSPSLDIASMRQKRLAVMDKNDKT